MPSGELKRNWSSTCEPPSDVATPEEVIFVDKLPKTRSGKIMRRVLKAVASGASIGDVTTLDDQTSVAEAMQAYEELKAAAAKSAHH